MSDRPHVLFHVVTNNIMHLKRMIFDIGNFSGQATMVGIPRYVIEVLQRLVESNRFDITTICSLPEEEFALRNFKRFFPYELPFQSKTVENYSLPEKAANTQPSRLARLENKFNDRFSNNRILKFLFDTARAVKWKISPPPFLVKRKRSSFYEDLVRKSDIYFSPFHPLIPELDVNPNIKKVLVVHDLIPVLYADIYKDHRFFQENPWVSLTRDVIVLTDSESTKRDLLRLYQHISENQITTVLLGVDDRFAPCDNLCKIDQTLKKYGIPSKKPYIFSVATLDVRKNFDHVMRCFARLVGESGNEFPELQLVLTGVKGWQNRKFFEMYGNMPQKIKNRIVFTGYVGDDDLPFLYAGADCFCYMSIYEGFGLPLLEAMKSGTPVIAADNSSLPEVVGDAGILLDAKDETGLIGAFKTVLSNESLRNEMIRKGLDRASLFSWNRCVEQIIKTITKDDSNTTPLPSTY